MVFTPLSSPSSSSSLSLSSLNCSTVLDETVAPNFLSPITHRSAIHSANFVMNSSPIHSLHQPFKKPEFTSNLCDYNLLDESSILDVTVPPAHLNHEKSCKNHDNLLERFMISEQYNENNEQENIKQQVGMKFSNIGDENWEKQSDEETIPLPETPKSTKSIEIIEQISPKNFSSAARSPLLPTQPPKVQNYLNSVNNRSRINNGTLDSWLAKCGQSKKLKQPAEDMKKKRTNKFNRNQVSIDKFHESPLDNFRKKFSADVEVLSSSKKGTTKNRNYKNSSESFERNFSNQSLVLIQNSPKNKLSADEKSEKSAKFSLCISDDQNEDSIVEHVSESFSDVNSLDSVPESIFEIKSDGTVELLDETSESSTFSDITLPPPPSAVSELNKNSRNQLDQCEFRKSHGSSIDLINTSTSQLDNFRDSKKKLKQVTLLEALKRSNVVAPVKQSVVSMDQSEHTRTLLKVLSSPTFARNNDNDDSNDNDDKSVECNFSSRFNDDGKVRRKKHERQLLHGFDCRCCAEYYEALGLNMEERCKRIDQVSKHRDVAPIPTTPEHYWEIRMPNRDEHRRRGQVIESNSPIIAKTRNPQYYEIPSKKSARRKLFS